MPQPTAFTHDEIEFKPLPSQGVYVGIGIWKDKPFLAYCAMMQDGSPETNEYGKPDWGETINLDQRQDYLDEINNLLGSKFTLQDIEGRML